MVATFYLHCAGHRVKYGNPEVGNNTQQFFSTIRPCCSFEFIESFLFWVILVRYNIGINICIYIYKVSYIHSFFVVFNCNVFSALLAKNFEITKNILWNWRVHCFIAWSFKCCKRILMWQNILEVFWRIYLNIIFWILLGVLTSLVNWNLNITVSTTLK